MHMECGTAGRWRKYCITYMINARAKIITCAVHCLDILSSESVTCVSVNGAGFLGFGTGEKKTIHRDRAKHSHHLNLPMRYFIRLFQIYIVIFLDLNIFSAP